MYCNVFLPFQFDKYGKEVPCFPPLVRTYNDQNGQNSPNISEIVAACAQTGCTPTCPRAGGMCVKYTVTNRNKDRTIAWESHFCGEGITWDGSVISGRACYSEQNVNNRGVDHSVCFCNNMSLCNSAITRHSVHHHTLIAIIFIFFLIKQ